MYFHHPWYLAALPLALAPAVLHLLALRRAAVVRFAWTHVVRRALQHSSSRRKLVDRIVLMVRCLLIAVCLLYFARPVGYVDPAARGRVQLTIAVDTSLSMRRRGPGYPIFSACVERVDRLLLLLERAGVQVQVVAFDTAVRPVTVGSVGAAQARAAVTALSAGWLGTDVGALLQWWTARAAAQDATANERLHHKLLVLTDGAAHGVRTPPTLHTGTPASSRRDVLFWHPPFGGPNGRATDVLFDVVDDGVVTVRCSFAGVPAGAQVLLAADGGAVDALVVDGTSDWYTFAWHPRARRGDTALEIRLPDDVLPDDNVFRCVYRGVPRRRLFCRVEEALDLRGVDSLRFYLDRLEGAGWEVVYSPTGGSRSALPGSLELRVGVRAMQPEEPPGQQPVLIFPPVDADTASYERFADGVEFVEVRPASAGAFRLIHGQDARFNAFCEQYDLRHIAVFRAWRVTITAPASGWRPVLYFNDGTPAMVARGSVWLSAFPLDRASTNLILKPFFIGLLGYVAATGDPVGIIGSYEIVGASVPLGGRSSVTRYPDGGAVSPDDVSLASDGVRFLKPGWYRVGGEGDSTLIGVNADPREGDLTPVSAQQLRGMLRAAGADSSAAATRVFRDGDVSDVAAWCLGREYTGVLAVGMALLFAAETALSRLGRRMV